LRGWPGGSPTAATPPREMKFKIVTILPCTADEYITYNDTSEYKKLQLETTNSFERTNVTTCKDGVCTQVIVNKPSIDIPRVVKFMMKGREMEFTDTRTWEDRVKKEGRFPLTQTFLQTNNITDRCLSKGTITVEDVEVAEEEEGAGTKAKKAGGAKKAQEKKTKRCSITAEGEVIVRIGPLSNFAEGQVIEHMRAAYGKFPGIVERWREILAEREKTKAAKAAEEEDAISAERLVAEDATVSEDAEDAVMTDALDSTATTATATATTAPAPAPAADHAQPLWTPWWVAVEYSKRAFGALASTYTSAFSSGAHPAPAAHARAAQETQPESARAHKRPREEDAEDVDMLADDASSAEGSQSQSQSQSPDSVLKGDSTSPMEAWSEHTSRIARPGLEEPRSPKSPRTSENLSRSPGKITLPQDEYLF